MVKKAIDFDHRSTEILQKESRIVRKQIIITPLIRQHLLVQDSGRLWHHSNNFRNENQNTDKNDDNHCNRRFRFHQVTKF